MPGTFKNVTPFVVATPGVNVRIPATGTTPLTLTTFIQVDARGLTGANRGLLNSAILGAQVEYHLQDLETGAMVPSIAGGAITGPLTTAALFPLTVAGGPLDGLPSNTTDYDYFQSAASAPISVGASGSGATLMPPAGDNTGTWRLLTEVSNTSGGAGLTTFDDSVLIEVFA